MAVVGNRKWIDPVKTFSSYPQRFLGDKPQKEGQLNINRKYY